MNESESTQGRAQTTEQIATAGAGSEGATGSGQIPQEDSGQIPQEDSRQIPQEDSRPISQEDGRTEQPAPTQQAAARSDLGGRDQPHAPLLEDHEMQNILVRWKDIQAEFVDEPRKAVQDADALVAELMQRLAQMFASERQQLESRWAGGDDVSTEDLRHGLRRYRSFFERLLAA
jgi:hypothetical protein